MSEVEDENFKNLKNAISNRADKAGEIKTGAGDANLMDLMSAINDAPNETPKTTTRAEEYRDALCDKSSGTKNPSNQR
jgi:hypothetical protein